MIRTPRQKILVVDDETSVRTTVSGLLTSKDYEVSTAENGFDALLQMRNVTFALIISDLNMPQMSGFEFLSVVRRRFPEVLVVAMSGAYSSGDAVPGGVIADGFYAKGGRTDPVLLLGMVADLLQATASRQTAHRSKAARCGFRAMAKIRREVPTWCSPAHNACGHFPCTCRRRSIPRLWKHRASSALARCATSSTSRFP